MEGPPYVCPYNSYHKLLEYRKWVYHVTKCGDRRGKVVHRCPYKHDHIFVDKAQFASHIKDCPDRIALKKDQESPAVSEEEIQKHISEKSTYYCKYDVEHSFASEELCGAHMETCPKKAVMEQKLAQCDRIYTTHKKSIQFHQE